MIRLCVSFMFPSITIVISPYPFVMQQLAETTIIIIPNTTGGIRLCWVFPPSSSILNQSKEVCYPTLRHLDRQTRHNTQPLAFGSPYLLFSFLIYLLSLFYLIFLVYMYILNILFQVEVQNHSKENRMNVK